MSNQPEQAKDAAGQPKIFPLESQTPPQVTAQVQAPKRPVITQQAPPNMQNANQQLMNQKGKAQPPTPEKKEKATKTGAIGLRTKKVIYVVGFLVALLIPVPKQVGGDIEISGAPTVNQALIRPSVNGTLQSINVKTGQQVKAGDVLATLRNWEIEEKIMEGEKQVMRIKSAQAALLSQVRVAEDEYKKAYDEYLRQKAETDFITNQAKELNGGASAPSRIESTRKQLEQIKLQAESMNQRASLHKYLADEGVYPKQSALQSAYEAASAEKQVEALKAQLKAEEDELNQRSVESNPKLSLSINAANANKSRVNTAKAEFLGNEIQMAEAQKQLDIYRLEKDQLTLKSPIDGVVLTLKTDLLLGQNFNKGDTVAVIGNLSELKVNIQLPEEDRALVQEGQKVTARVRAVTDTVFSGIVESIAPVTSETGEQTSKRKIWDINMVLQNEKGALSPGMTGYARIHTGHWRPLVFLAWDETYKAFRLDRYIDRNPLGGLFSGGKS